MNYTATITSKMQVTVPQAVAKKLRLKAGQKVVFSANNGQATITPVNTLIEQLAGSLKTPKKWKGKSIDEIIELAKAEYFHRKE